VSMAAEDGALVPSVDAARVLEAVLFLADEPMTPASLAGVIERPRPEVERILSELAESYDRRRSGLILRHVAGGWRLFTHPDVAAHVQRFVLSSRHARLTKAALETLAIVAYKQPVTRHQISSIRGVNSEGVLRALCDRGLVQEVGRDEGPGRAVLYGTTPEFLERLGVASLADLPPIAPLLAEADAQTGASRSASD
jgi:segregation and condensation protein B